MKLAILFWFYKEPGICENHLAMLRKYNPDTPIYGLYGGEPKEADTYSEILSSYLDDFYIFNQNKDSDWKWHLGDLLITDWYRERGKNLSWDTIIIVQWDMLVFGSVDNLFAMLKKDQILLSGLRPIQEIEDNWSWTSSSITPELREKYLNFLEYVKERYDYNQEALCCLFIVVCFPRGFLEKYSTVEQPELGFLEYSVPIYAQIFKTPFCIEHPFNAWWPGDPTTRSAKTLNAKRHDVTIVTILRHLLNQEGVRVFHPYRKIFPLRKEQWFWVLPVVLKERLEWLVRKARQVRYSEKY